MEWQITEVLDSYSSIHTEAVVRQSRSYCPGSRNKTLQTPHGYSSVRGLPSISQSIRLSYSATTPCQFATKFFPSRERVCEEFLCPLDKLRQLGHRGKPETAVPPPELESGYIFRTSTASCPSGLRSSVSRPVSRASCPG